jgi:hypothetical protein
MNLVESNWDILTDCYVANTPYFLELLRAMCLWARSLVIALSGCVQCDVVLCAFRGIFFISGVRLIALFTAAITSLLYQPRMIDDGGCGAIGGMNIGRGNRSTRGKLAPTPLCPLQFPHDLTRAWTRAAAVGNRQLTAWAVARPLVFVDGERCSSLGWETTYHIHT